MSVERFPIKTKTQDSLTVGGKTFTGKTSPDGGVQALKTYGLETLQEVAELAYEQGFDAGVISERDRIIDAIDSEFHPAATPERNKDE